MDPLATPDDVTSRYPGTLTADQAARVPTLLADASVTVRTFTRQQFSVATTTERIRPLGDKILLRQKPVTAVSAVGIVDMLEAGSLVVLPMGSWIWDGGQEVWVGAIRQVVNLPEEVAYLLLYQTPLMQVTYTHGYPVVPSTVLAVVCAMVLRALDIPGPTSVSSSTVGAVTYRLATVAQDVIGLTEWEQTMLRPYRRPATTLELR